jgi:uncharacterized protein (TIGR02466 family)
LNVDLHFATPLWWEDTGLDVSAMLGLCRALRQQDPAGRQASNQGGWQSRDFPPAMHAEMAPLASLILARAAERSRDYGFRDDLCRPVLANFWFNVNGPGCSNGLHIHDDTFIAGAFYLQARPGQGTLTLYKDIQQDYIVRSQAPIGALTPLSASAVNYEPVTGRLLLFPGWVPHGVALNPTADERVSVSFNVRLARPGE